MNPRPLSKANPVGILMVMPVAGLVLLILLLLAMAARGVEASWYDANGVTAASWFYPLGTKLLVQSSGVHGSRSVVVTVNDRGPAWRLVRQGRVIDLSGDAFAQLADKSCGLVTVRIEILPAKPHQQLTVGVRPGQATLPIGVKLPTSHLSNPRRTGSFASGQSKT
jgi:rare lipoprotein A (peptidoglycan hydrolase)